MTPHFGERQAALWITFVVLSLRGRVKNTIYETQKGRTRLLLLATLANANVDV